MEPPSLGFGLLTFCRGGVGSPSDAFAGFCLSPLDSLGQWLSTPNDCPERHLATSGDILGFPGAQMVKNLPAMQGTFLAETTQGAIHT